MALSRRLRVAQEQLEESDEVVGVPLPGGVRLPEAELAASGDPVEEGAVVDHQPHRCAGAEAAERPTRQLDLERSALESGEGTLEQGHGRALEEAAATCDGRGPHAHGRTLPCPGTNGGLWWNGTRFCHSRSASKWIRAMICSGCSG